MQTKPPLAAFAKTHRYALAGFLWVPRWARPALVNFAATQLERRRSIGEMHSNPFTFVILVKKLSFTEGDGSPW